MAGRPVKKEVHLSAERRDELQRLARATGATLLQARRARANASNSQILVCKELATS
ncbi:MAG TPA: hypothetical protein VG406_11070 [Isosphaeraceae bacterium]|nr:hypothetical protein [Isosphaeraceae bacterium]